MKSIRRLYFYAVAFVSLELVLWGLIGLLRSIVSSQIIADRAGILAQGMALVLVGVPVFLIHWLWAQRAAGRDEEERSAGLRAIFLYAALFATVVPVVHNLLPLANRLLLATAKLPVERALFGPLQSWTDNLIAILINLLMAAYFWSILREEWRAKADVDNLADVRRLYRYVWVLYGVLMLIFGSQQVLRYILQVPSSMLGGPGRDLFINGAVLILIGTPVWYLAWRSAQAALHESREQDSLLRLGVLYVLALGGVFSVLTAGAGLLATLLRRLLGEPSSAAELLTRLGLYASVIVPLGTVWAYYGQWLRHEIESDEAPQGKSGKLRLYAYILSLIGLAATVFGLASLLWVIIELALGIEPVGGDVFRRQLAGALSALVVALPLWMQSWRPMQAEALRTDESGDHARRSVLRKAYLYLVLFGSVIGGMVSAVSLVYQLIQAALTGDTSGSFLPDVLSKLQLLALFVLMLTYHLGTLRRDGAMAAGALGVKQAGFSVIAIEAGGAADGIKAAFAKHASAVKLRTTRLAALKAKDATAGAVLLPGSLAMHPPARLAAWLRRFKGSTLVVADDAERVHWTRDAVQAAQVARALAEGQPVRSRPVRGLSAWTVVMYVFAGLFGLQLLFVLVALAVSAITSF